MDAIMDIAWLAPTRCTEGRCDSRLLDLPRQLEQSEKQAREISVVVHIRRSKDGAPAADEAVGVPTSVWRGWCEPTHKSRWTGFWYNIDLKFRERHYQ